MEYQCYSNNRELYINTIFQLFLNDFHYVHVHVHVVHMCCIIMMTLLWVLINFDGWYIVWWLYHTR